MPPKLTVSDFRFFFAPDEEGKYLWRGRPGNIFRRTEKEFNKMMLATKHNSRNEYEVLYAIANIEVVETGEQTLVYDIYEDLREEK